ncbi:MAG: DUF928 domain-containing protein, partial [Cyanobacteria bacterium J06632_22]
PRQGSGGASRTGFTPPTENNAPTQTSGGASRDFGFGPPSDNSSPRNASGGASREAFIPPVDNAAPRSASGGAARTNDYGTSSALFQAVSESMLALTPDSFYGQTFRAHPTILTYVPASSSREAVFSLKDEAQNLIYQESVLLPQSGGIVAIELPASAPELEVGEYYQWFLTLQVEDQITPASPFVDAWIQRVEPTAALTETLAASDPLAAAELLAEQGIWYDTAAILSALQQDGSIETAESWLELLTSVGLEGVAEVPVIALIAE